MIIDGVNIKPDEGKVLYCKFDNRVFGSYGTSTGYIYYRYNKLLPEKYLLTEEDFEDVVLEDNQIIVDGVVYDVESMDYSYLKAFIVKIKYSNDDQIALMLNYQEHPEEYRDAFQKMQEWRDVAGCIAREYPIYRGDEEVTE